MTGVELYESASGVVSLEVRTEGESVWLTQQQLASLFGRDVTVIRRHIASARREELAGMATGAKFALVQREGERTVTRSVEHYNLDMVLSVGYRVKSPEGVHFRRWANGVLRRYVVEGVAVNERRLRELQQLVTIISRSADEVVSGVAEVIGAYLPTLLTLRDYDEGAITAGVGRPDSWTLSYDETRAVIDDVAARFPDDAMFGGERGEGLRGVIGAIYQGFAGQQLYPTVELKAANLLYLVVKDHPLTDGNKRSAAALFVHFLARNDALDRANISTSALAAITLMVAMSDPKEKDLMVALLVRMLAGGAA